MSNVRRVFAEKKPEYASAAKVLFSDIKSYLGIDTVSMVRVLIRYDVENVSDETFETAKKTIFSEPPVDYLYEEKFDLEGFRVFSVEYLPGQFDQRADSAEQCVKLINSDEEPVIKTATVYALKGDISDEQFNAIKAYCINPVDSREASKEKPDTLVTVYDTPADVEILSGFTAMADADFEKLYKSLSLAMTYNDFKFIRDYFKNEEKRDPSITEIRVLDTYWSDHCRHTTFQTELKNISFEDGFYKAPIEGSFNDYKDSFKKLYAGRDDKYICLMDLACIAAKELKKMGLLNDQEESDEINACSIVVPVDVDGKVENWLINFKNETHNHPTEIEPFGGAATCLGGAIRDPLSGRTYVYQAMRVTGAADPTVPVAETIPGKLPQKKLVTQAAAGYSSYGNQIGLATGLVKEIYHPGYVAKRMEIGAVIAAAKQSSVQRLTSDPGDKIILLGGRTGRDGIGGATGSSKAHDTESTLVCGAEVQKGNAPTERKLQHMFRRPEVSHMIKKCNDFGAGGVSVAIGELADGLLINLDLVPKKYAGLDGTELAISESQERMACVIAPSDVEQFLKYADEENLEAVEVATVTEEKRLILKWRDKEIVNLSRAFLDTNGSHQETDVTVTLPDEKENFFEKKEIPAVEDALKADDEVKAWEETVKDLNSCSQKGLVERFDGSIGAASVLMPYGGKYQMTETQTMIAKVPVPGLKTKTCTLMSYGFDPFLSSWSPYHGATFAVLDSLAKIAAAGADTKKTRFTFQEYFCKLGSDSKRWGMPFAALLGAYSAQMKLGLPSIGGKDSMSGTFNDLDVPPTLVSFAVDVAKTDDIITPEFKAAGDPIVLFEIEKDEYELPDFDQVKKLYALFKDAASKGIIKASYAVDGKGIALAVAKMAFGNMLGAFICPHCTSKDKFFAPGFGNIVAEIAADKEDALNGLIKAAGLSDFVRRIGDVRDSGKLAHGDNELSLEKALKLYKAPLDKVFPEKAAFTDEPVRDELFDAKNVYVCKNKVAKPHVFIPVFPGTNCEYDSARAFERAGASVTTTVFRNLTGEAVKESVEAFANEIKKAQIIMFPGGFSAGDEPEGSAKFFSNVFRNGLVKEEILNLLTKRDGLMLGICNGFQALIKLGLVPFGDIREQSPDAPTLTYNTIGRHVSHMSYTKVVSNLSPWLSGAKLGETYVNPVSHGEGRFVAEKSLIEKLFTNGQVATQYVDHEGKPSMDTEWNINGSFMAIEGITSPDGRVYGKMAHSERIGDGVAVNIYGEQDLKIFESGVKYFK